MTERSIRVAVDIGGTFTDLQILDAATGEAYAFKTPTTPQDPSIGLIAGIEGAAKRYGFSTDQVGLILHGTTIATNAVLERKLPDGALVTTAGFEDVLEIGRHLRRQVYVLKAEDRSLLIPRTRRYGVAERVKADGTVETPLDEAALGELGRRLAAEGVGAVAVAFLNAYANPAHERLAREILAEAAPGVAVSLSSDVSPEIREFERTSTTALNALLVPVVERYLRRIRDRLAEAKIPAVLYLVQSNGGVTSPGQAADLPARLLLSGPAGGAMAIAKLGRDLDETNLVAIDMGGTSSDVCVVEHGRLSIITEGEIDGLPVRLPMVEMRTIGAGGGSIAHVVPGAGLRVGPRSAGAEPGPVSYRRGGTEPAVTDANVVMGRIDPAYFLGGAMSLDLEGARRAVEEKVARPLGLGIEQAAEGIVTVANTSMAAAIRLSLFERGCDPQDFALVPFGGAGGLHALELAGELEIRRVIFPADASTLSARGILFADIVHDVARSRLLPADERALPDLREMAAELRAQGGELLARDDIPPEARRIELAADMRYVGQAFELLVPWGDVTPDAASLAELRRRFDGLHGERFAHQDEHDPVEIVTLRATATGLLPKPQPREGMATEAAEAASRDIWFGGSWVPAAILRRGAMPVGEGFTGPAVIEEEFTTILVPPGWRITRRAGGELLAERA